MKNHRIRKQLSLGGAYTFLIFWVLVCTFPLFAFFFSSFKSAVAFVSPSELFSFSDFTLANFQRAFAMGDFIKNLNNSLTITIASVLVSLTVCSFLSFGLSKINRRSRDTFSFFILSTRFVPYVVIALPMYLFFLNLGLSGTRVSLLMAHLAMQIPFSSWILLEFFMSIPREVEEAAIVDGCTPFNVFLRMSLPIIYPGLAACGILVFITSWNEYLFAVFLGGYQAQTLTVGITRFMASMDTGAQYGVIAAYGTIIMMPVIIFALIANRWIVSGLTSGAVKG